MPGPWTPSLGAYSTARLIMTSNASDTNTIGIGADTYTFLLTPTGLTGTIEVQLAGTANGTITNLVAAINDEGTEPVLAVGRAGVGVDIYGADYAGGTEVTGFTTSVVLTEAITAAADVWNQTNLRSISAPDIGYTFVCPVDIDALNATMAFELAFPMALDNIAWYAYSATGALLATTATVAIATDTTKVTVTPTAGIAPLVNTDRIVVFGFANA